MPVGDAFHRHSFPAPIECQVPGSPQHIRCYVTDIERRRNVVGGPVLTLACGWWSFIGRDHKHRIAVISTQMELADMLSDQHAEPVNADKLYGPRGRLGYVGRTCDLDRCPGCGELGDTPDGGLCTACTTE